MTRQEQQRAHVLTRVQQGTLTVPDAARLMGRSIRQIQRLLSGFRRRGLAALAHGNRGRPSPHRLADTIRTQVVTLARTHYADLNDHHLTDLLVERHGLHISRPTVYRLLRAAGVPRPRKRRPPRHRRQRERMPQAGLLVQLDGSHHPWLQARGPHLVLIAAIDDATNRVLGATFRLREDAHGYFLVLQQVLRRYGVPCAVYTDRHGIFHRNRRAPQTVMEQLQDSLDLTQVGRALHELGIRWIPASSPQAKGRIERLFGTLQDRLVHELRLASAATLVDANRALQTFLPRYNRRFARPPAQTQPAFRPRPPQLETILCFKYPRIVANDNTVRLGEHLLQILPGPGGRSYAKAHVHILERPDGPLTVLYHDTALAFDRLTPRPTVRLPLRPRPFKRHRRRVDSLVQDPRPAPPAVRPGPHKLRPGRDHPWNQFAREGLRRKQLKAQGVTFSLTH